MKHSIAALMAFIGCLWVESTQAQWVQSQKWNNLGYFLFSYPPRIEQCVLTNGQWLAPITLPSTFGLPSAFCVDDKGIYVAYGQTVRRYDLNGKNEAALINTPDPVIGLLTDGDLLFVNRSSGLYARFTSLNKVNGTIIAQYDAYIDAVSGASIARSVHRIFGRSIGVSPSDITYVTYNTNGTFVGGGDSPYHGDYPGGTKTWVFPDDGKVVDSSGTVYSTAGLLYLNSFGTQVDDLDFYGSDIPIVLHDNTLIAYANSLLPTGSRELSYAPQTIYVAGNSVLTFTPDTNAANKIRLDSVPLATLNPPIPNQPVNPNGLPYTPDATFIDNSGVCYLLCKSQQSIFRWDITNQQYLGTIPLATVPRYVAYSADNNRIYLAEESGLIRQIDLSSTNYQATPFATLATAPEGLAVAGRYVFATDGSGAWGTHYTFDASGNKVASKDWNYYSTEYIWSEANQKMYFFRDDTSPNDILWEEINANGVAYPSLPPGGIGGEIDSPLHDSAGFVHPIRVSPDGSVVVLGSGVIHDAKTLARLPVSLGNAVTDAAWVKGSIKTIRSISGVMQCQDWSLANLGLNVVRQFPGTANCLLAIDQNRLLGIAINEGLPSFYILDPSFNVIAPAVILPPSSLQVRVVASNCVDLRWPDTTGETGYVIERKTGLGGAWSQIGTTSVSATNYSDATVQLGALYYYRVFATNGARASSPSAEQLAVLVTPEAPPVFTATTLSATAIRLEWSSVPHALGYLVERSLTNGAWTQIASLGQDISLWTNSSLNPDTAYSYRIRATNVIGSSSYSCATALTDASVPNAPVLSNATSSNAYSVLLAWQNVSYEDAFVIERSIGTNGAWNIVTITAANVTSFKDSTVSPLTFYQYRVYATNRAGASAYSNVKAVTTPQVAAPTTPTGIVAKALSASSIKIEWNAVPGASGYRVQRRTEDPSSWTLISMTPSNITSYLDTNLVQGVHYYYRVLAFSQYGDSSFSNEADAIPNTIVRLLEDNFDPKLNPSAWLLIQGGIVTNAPVGFISSNALWFGAEGPRLAATVSLDLFYGGVLNFSFRAGNENSNGVALWDSSEAGENVVLEYSCDNGPWTTLAYLTATSWTNFSIAVPVAARSSSTQFRWRQPIHSGPGYDCWALDNISVEGAAPRPPAAPAFLIANPASATSISVWWTEVSGASWYALERKNGTNAWVEITRTPVMENYFQDSSVSPSSAYSYRVKSINAGGQSKYSSTTMVATWSQKEQWIYENFGTIDAIAIPDLEIPDHTGVPPLLRFAFNLSAEEPGRNLIPGTTTSGFPAIWVDSGRRCLCIEFVRRKAASNPEVTYQVQFSEQLGAWTPLRAQEKVTDLDLTWERVRYEEPTDPTAPSRFYRVGVYPK